VFDGVGGWYRRGVDPRKYPEDLSQRMLTIFEEDTAATTHGVLSTAWEASELENGSCTACAYSLCPDGMTLDVLNLGDSGAIVIRNGDIVYETSMQESVWNMPYQLGPLSRQTPRDAEIHQWTMKEGDVVVLATDGLFSNMGNEEIADFVSKRSDKVVSTDSWVEAVAEDLANQAFAYARDTVRVSPYTQRAWDEGFDDVFGGKMDDITVIISRCVRV